MKSFVLGKKYSLALVVGEALGFFEDKKREKQPSEGRSTEEEEGASDANGFGHEHEGCDHGDDEHPEPVGDRREGHAGIVTGVGDVHEGEGACSQLVGEEVE